MTGLTHFDDQGQAHMVDVSDKPVTARVAVARGTVKMTAETLALITEGRAKKGDVLGIARLAGIMAAKKKPLDEVKLEDLASDTELKVTYEGFTPPAARKAGIKVKDVAELVGKLKNEAKVL